MLSYFSTYKFPLIFGMLAVYLAGSFQSPALEALHAFSHLAEQLLVAQEDKVYFHLHGAHRHAHVAEEVESHQHTVIRFLDTFLGNFSGEQPHSHQNKKLLKKKSPENPGVPVRLAFSSVDEPSRFFKVNKLTTIYKLSVPSPPPKAFISILFN